MNKGIMLIEGKGGIYNPINLSLYTYTHNNPVKYVDPTGEESLDIELYTGVGAGIHYASNINDKTGETTTELTVHFGIGFGGGISYDPDATPSAHAYEGKKQGTIVRSNATLNLNAGIGTADVSMGGTVYSANEGNTTGDDVVIVDPVLGTIKKTPAIDGPGGIPAVSTGEGSKFGVRGSARASIELGFYGRGQLNTETATDYGDMPDVGYDLMP